MLDKTGFDLWAGGYDKAVGLSDEQNSYPFAGYKKVLASIYRTVLAHGPCPVLDLGFGTAVLTSQLYERGCEVWGMDFSPKMLETAEAKMPGAHLFLGDLTAGLPPELRSRRYALILSTYALHHLTDDQKPGFLRELLPLLAPGGQILIGDVAFASRRRLEECRAQAGDGWDGDEFYFVYDELKPLFPALAFEERSFPTVRAFSPCRPVSELCHIKHPAASAAGRFVMLLPGASPPAPPDIRRIPPPWCPPHRLSGRR